MSHRLCEHVMKWSMLGKEYSSWLYKYCFVKRKERKKEGREKQENRCVGKKGKGRERRNICRLLEWTQTVSERAVLPALVWFPNRIRSFMSFQDFKSGWSEKWADMKVSTGHPLQGTKETTAEVAKALKSMPKRSTVEKQWLSHCGHRIPAQTQVWDTGHW